MPEPIPLPKTIIKRIKSGLPLTLELGCGNHKRHPEAIGIDALAYDGVDIVGDIHSILLQFPEQSVSAVYAYHCFEHLDDVKSVLNQLARIMKQQSLLVVVVPHFSNPYYYSDITHRQFFGLYTFSYLALDKLFARRCPTYQCQLSFKVNKIKLVFKSPRPFYGRWGVKKVIQIIINLNRYFLEFYEENMCWMIPCYEIYYELERL